jgi:hypothetical protein
MRIGFNWEAECARKTEISELNVTVFVNEKVLRLQIAVHYSVRMAVSCCLQDLVGEALHFLRRQRASDLSHILFEVVVAVFEDKIELIFGIEHLF